MQCPSKDNPACVVARNGSVNVCSLGDDRIDLPIIEGKTNESTLLLPTDLAKVTEEGKKVKEKEESSMVAVVEGIQPLPKKAVKKIDACEYVDFSDLHFPLRN